MAARFWVPGGSGVWNETSNWSATTGGASGASFPTSADTATFDANSGAAPSVSITGGGSQACSSLTVTKAGTSFSLFNTTLDIYGSISVVATTAFSGAGQGERVQFLGTVAGRTITTNSCSFNSFLSVFISPTGAGTYSLGSAFVTSGGFTVENAVFTTAGFALTAGNISISSGGITAGASAITASSSITIFGGTNTLNTCTITAPSFTADTAATITPGTSTVVISNTGTLTTTDAGVLGTTVTLAKATFTIGGTISVVKASFSGVVTFSGGSSYGASMSSTVSATFSAAVSFAAGMVPIITGGSTGNTFSAATTCADGLYVYGINTFAALTASKTSYFNGTMTVTTLTLGSLATGAYVYTFNPAGTYTVSTSLVASGTSGINRIRIASATVGSAATISAAATTLTDVDFADITKAGAAGWTGTRIGDAGGNTGITFTAAKNVFLAGTIGYNVTAGFALTSGGAVATTNIALPQDTLYVDNNSGNSGVTVTFNADGHIYPTINMSGRSVPLTVSTGTVDVNVFGSLILQAAITLSGTTIFYLMARSASSLTPAGVTITQGIVVVGTGKYTLNNTLIITGPSGLSIARGELDLSTYALTAFSFGQSGGTLTYNTQNIVTLTGSGSGVISISSGTRTGTGTLTFNTTFTGSTSTTMSVTATEATAPNVNVTAGTYALGMSGSYNSVTFTGFSGSISATGSSTIYGNYTVSSGMSFTAATTTITFAGTSGSKVITTNGKAFNRNITFNGAGAVFLLVGSMSTGTVTTKILTLTAGSVGFGGYAVTCGLFSSSGTGVRTLGFEGSTLTVIGSGATAFNTGTNTNLTVSGTGIVSMTSATAKTFAGGGTVFTAALNQGGTGALTITGSNTLYNLTNTVQPTSVLFTPSTTTTFTEDFDLNGTAGNLVTVGTVGSTGTFTVSKSIGTIGTNYLSLSRSTATGGALWYAGGNSTDGGNNTGWVFSTYSGNTSGFFAFF